MKLPIQSRRGRAVILLEVMLAVAVFGVAAVALVRLINDIAVASIESQTEMRVVERLESLLEEYGKAPNLRIGKFELPTDDQGTACLVTIQSVTPQSAQGLPLENMFQIRITARWQEDGRTREMTAKNLRYGPMYQ